MSSARSEKFFTQVLKKSPERGENVQTPVTGKMPVLQSPGYPEGETVNNFESLNR